MPRKGIGSSDLHITMFNSHGNVMVVYSNFRFRLHVVAYDQTGKLDVIISDREVYEPHRFIGYRARDVIPEVKFVFPFR